MHTDWLFCCQVLWGLTVTIMARTWWRRSPPRTGATRTSSTPYFLGLSNSPELAFQCPPRGRGSFVATGEAGAAGRSWACSPAELTAGLPCHPLGPVLYSLCSSLYWGKSWHVRAEPGILTLISGGGSCGYRLYLTPFVSPSSTWDTPSRCLPVSVASEKFAAHFSSAGVVFLTLSSRASLGFEFMAVRAGVCRCGSCLLGGEMLSLPFPLQKHRFCLSSLPLGVPQSAPCSGPVPRGLLGQFTSLLVFSFCSSS